MHACALSKMGLSNKRFWISICWRKTLFTEVEHYKIRAFPYSIPNIIKTRKRKRERNRDPTQTTTTKKMKWNWFSRNGNTFIYIQHVIRTHCTFLGSRCEYLFLFLWFDFMCAQNIDSMFSFYLWHRLNLWSDDVSTILVHNVLENWIWYSFRSAYLASCPICHCT